MYQLEVKHLAVEHLFPTFDGWKVIVDVDAMERAKGPQQKPDKKVKVTAAEAALMELGVRIGAHPIYGRVDIAAEHPAKGKFLIEVEGKSSKQKEQAMYSALGQTILMMTSSNPKIFYGLAVPDEPEWERQLIKIPNRIKSLLNLKCYLISVSGARAI